MKYFLFVILFLCISQGWASGWSQMGADIDGEAAGDRSGDSVSLSADGIRVAVGGAYNNSYSGHVRIFEYSGVGWIQLGADIDGEAAGDYSGSVSLSADGTRVAIGAYNNDGNGSNSGHVRIFEYSSNGWIQLGADIDGEASDDQSGRVVSLSADGRRVAIGAKSNDGNGTSSGHVRVFEYLGDEWVQLGADIDGEAAGDISGGSVSLSADGIRVAIGAILNQGNGHVRIFEYLGSEWVQLGTDIDGEAAGDYSGSVSLSADGTRVAIGASRNDGHGTDTGHVRIFEYLGGEWLQLGADINGAAPDDRSGSRVSLSADGTRVAIGAPYNDSNGSNSGHVRLFEYLDGIWVQLGIDVDGEAEGDLSSSVSLSADGTCVAIGASHNDGNGLRSGHVRVYANPYIDFEVVGIGTISPASGFYGLGTNLVLEATAGLGSLFMGWSGDIVGDYTTTPTNLYIDGSKSITATFSEDADNDWLTNIEEASFGTNPRKSDTDEDGLGDGSEVNTYNTNPLDADSDDDGLNDGSEVNVYGTDPNNSDSDSDGLGDEGELNIYSTDPLDADSDDDGLNDGTEVNIHGTDPNNSDSDNDELSDGSEIDIHNTDPLDIDSDDDGLNDGEEVNIHGTDPLDADSDDDGLTDGVEVNTHSTNPNNSDSDNDGLSDASEINIHGTDPLDADSDDDGLDDGAEVNTHSTDPFDTDSDDDGLDDGTEINTYSTSPLASDSDDDGLNDGSEVNIHGTDPLNADSDSDGLDDGVEVNTYGTDPNDSDSDDDELSDAEEVNVYGTDPNNPDSDSDILPDGWEVVYGYDPFTNDARKDLDDDNLTGLEEYNLGTSPVLLDTDGDGFNDDVEVLRLGTDALDLLNPVQVDDDAANDPLSGDPAVSDPLEDGTKDHPYDSVQEAIDATSDGDNIVVLDGIYRGSGNRDIRLGGREVVLQSLNGSDHTLIEENFYGGFICDASEGTNTIIKGFSVHTWKDFFGEPGILCVGSSPTILDCRLWDCGEAGVLCTNGASPRIIGCEIVGNEGGIRSYSSSPLIESCSVVSNTSLRGAGLSFFGTSSAQIINCLIADNNADEEGGGVWIDSGSDPQFIHCTVSGNYAGMHGGGISSSGSPLLRNSIVYDNVATDSAGIFYSSALDVQYTCLQEFYPGIGNITTDPSMVSDTFMLGVGSPAIDIGTVVYGVPFDLAGAQRPLDGTNDGAPGYDLGAYEFVHGSSDTDGDEMPDYWELAHQFDPVSNDTEVDSDGDGQDNHAEYIAGLDPNDRTSFFAVTSENLVSDFVVEWPSVTGRWYEVLWTPNLTNSFQSLVGFIDHPQSSYTDTTHHAESTGFYKIEVRLK